MSKRRKDTRKPDPRQKYRKVPEWFTSKYDDVSREERAVLAKMDSLEKPIWRINDFRGITSLNNDGDKIKELLSTLGAKGYVRLVETKKPRKQPRSSAGPKKQKKTSKWELAI